MNNKIKEFAQQVNVDIIEPEYAKIGGVSEVNFETYQDLEKFSELIIRECTNTIIKAYSGHINPKIAVDAVNKHFGIEK